ncbi:MAG: tetratricopeptide repeat-containing serine protease family protein [Candidatus Poribacteria bacterium]|nr:tetratricopeptide repeat-containing serine protease family protein [Candidatus Poribacteria bacterium]
MKDQNKPLCHLFIVTFTVLLFCLTNSTTAQTVPEIAEKALAATVYLEMKDSVGLPLGFGSGFFVKPNLIATNYHVIAGAASGTAKLVGKYTTYKIEGWTATDEDNDLALLKVSAYGIKPLPLGNSDAVKIGETVYVAGNPKGLEGTFSDGIISSRRGKYTKERFQMTAPISPGSSGGPVLNSKGEVIGVSVAVHRDLDAQNLNFSIRSNYLGTLLTHSKPTKPLSKGNQTISAETYFRRGYACYDLELYDLAIANYDKAIQLKPDYAEAYHNRGIAKGDLGQHFAAISDYDKAIQLKPDDANAYGNRGIAKGKLGKYFAAISDFDKAIQLKPDLAKGYYNRGVAKGDLGQHSAAISDYDKAIQLESDYSDAYINRGLAKALLNRTWEAKQDLRAALRLAEKSGDVDTKARVEIALQFLFLE